jgi:SAM-dependent methyltransferase
VGERKRRPDRLSLSHLEWLLHYHDILLRDRVRNVAFRRALTVCVQPGDRVLDVGTGTGVWAVLAAQRGARRVVAIEREPMLRPVIQRLLVENGVASRVELITGDFREASLTREFDVVVSETVGNLAFDEDIVPIMAEARERCLVPGGTLLPHAIAVAAAPVRLRAGLPQPVSLPVRLESFAALLAHVPRGVRGDEVERLAPAAELARVPLTAETARGALDRVSGLWRLTRARRLDGVAVWLRLGLAPRLWLDTAACDAWHPTLFPVERFEANAGTFDFSLESSSRPRRWRAALTRRGGREERDYCPELAYGSVRAALSRDSSGA